MSTPPETTVKAPGFDWADAAQHWFQACRGGFDAWLALCNAALAGAERVRVWRLYLRAARNGFETGFTSIYQVRARLA